MRISGVSVRDSDETPLRFGEVALCDELVCVVASASCPAAGTIAT